MAKVYDNATDLITFARLQSQNTTSGSSYLGSDGLLKFAAEDEPRIEYAADGSLKGLLIEEQRTNLIANSTPQSGDLDVSGGSFSYVTCNFTPLSGPGIHFDTPGVSAYAYFTPTYTAADYTFSVFVEMDDGNAPSFTNSTISAVGNDFGFIVEASLTNPLNYTVEHYGGNTYRVSGTVTSSSTTARNTGIIKYSTNSSRTFKVTGFQLEQGSFPTSYIPTSGSQSTRSPDIASIPVSAFGYNQEAGTVVVEASFNGFTPNGPTGYPRVWALDQVFGDYLALMSSASKSVFYRDNEWNGAVDALTATEGVAFRAAVAFSDGDAAVSGNGGVASTASPVSTLDMPSNLSLGSVAGLRSLNGHLKSIQYFPRRLTDAQLQELTS